ncbi:hypothetical protein [Pseudogemmobacter humi]|uniref:Uncharacterized protein n=1 Tax=Pseudogemmobacter humi TaxID=2483812 RepID=A0A3P5WW19_9RHOB|nr:hypothetical protein [Pseudogemmobacter humi]VDC20187.1 hypothetical protein XINFAN_00363 [Pseudogemmobacter humi]
MMIVAIVFGGVFGLVFGLGSWLMGFGLLASLIVYVVAGNLLSLWLMARLRVEDGIGENPLTEARIREDLAALQEAEARRMALAASDGSSLFRLLRMRAELDRIAASERTLRHRR